MLMVRTDPVMPMAYLQDRLGQDSIAPRRAKAFTAQDFRNVEVRVALSPQLPGALDHCVVAGDVMLVQDGRDDDALREMTTDPDDLDLNPIRGYPLDHHAGNQAAQQRLALRVTELRARPQIGEALTQVQQWLAGLWRQRRLTRLMGEALCRLLSLTQSAQSVIPRALEFGRREAVGRVDVFVAAPGQGGGEAGLTDLLLMVSFKPLALTLTLCQHLI